MITPDQLNRLKELLSLAQSVVVAVGAEPSFDQLAAAGALAQVLIQAGKEVTVASPQELAAEMSELSGSSLFRQQLGSQNLWIGMEYQETMIDKVSYHLDEDNRRFYVVIKPQKGHKPVDSSALDFSYSGAEAQLVFLIGVHSWQSLEQLYVGYEDLYSQATTVTIHTFEPEIGNLKINVGDTSSFSEGVASMIMNLELPFSPEAAADILAGIETASNGLQSLSVTADTFELVAQLMRLGGRRPRRKSQPAVANSMPVKQPATMQSGAQSFERQPVEMDEEVSIQALSDQALSDHEAGVEPEVVNTDSFAARLAQAGRGQPGANTMTRESNDQIAFSPPQRPKPKKTQPGGLKHQPSQFSGGS